MPSVRLRRLLTGASRWLIGLCIIGVFLLHPLAWFGKNDFLSKLEAIAYDARLKMTLTGKGDPQVVIIDIDEASLQREGRWPWPRNRLAKLTTDLLDRYHARVVVFDVFFAERDFSSGITVLERLARTELKNVEPYQEALSRLRPQLDFDALFADAMRGRPVVLGFGFTEEKQAVGQLPLPAFTQSDLGDGVITIRPEGGYAADLPILAQAASASGHVDPAFDRDYIVRRVPLVKLYRDAYFPALSLAAVQVVVEAKRITPKFDADGKLDTLDVGGLPVRVARDGTALIPFRGPPRTFKYHSAADILAGGVDSNAFTGAIALVGTTSKGLKDLRPTPLDPDFAGAEIHASLISGMLNGELKRIPAGASAIEELVMVIAGLLALFAVPYRRPFINTLGVLLIAAIVVGLNLAVWSYWNEVLPLAATLSLLLTLYAWNMLAGFARESQAMRKLSDMFGEYVPKERVAEMRESGQRFTLAGESRELTVLFSDVRNFTALSEDLAPPEISALMNAYLTPMTEVIHDCHGTVDKYVGDAVMAFWGAPIANPNHARDAVTAALRMQEKMPRLREEFARRGWPELNIAIGVNTGIMNVGDMGSQFRKAYTVMGDAVNLASRLESLTKQYGVGVIIGENTRAQLGGWICRELDRVRVKGRGHPVAIYEPWSEKLQQDRLPELAAWEEALAAYRQREWTRAETLFESLAQRFPDTPLYGLYRMRATTYAQEPPPEDWDGTFSFVKK